jgi:hypothetical protein
MDGWKAGEWIMGESSVCPPMMTNGTTIIMESRLMDAFLVFDLMPATGMHMNHATAAASKSPLKASERYSGQYSPFVESTIINATTGSS